MNTTQVDLLCNDCSYAFSQAHLNFLWPVDLWRKIRTGRINWPHTVSFILSLESKS